MWDLIVSVPDHCLSFYFKRPIEYSELRDVLTKYDLLCITETKLDQTDVPGYTFVSQNRKQNFIGKSGGTGLFYKD